MQVLIDVAVAVVQGQETRAQHLGTLPSQRTIRRFRGPVHVETHPL
jgi:hypothetical protein